MIKHKHIGISIQFCPLHKKAWTQLCPQRATLAEKFWSTKANLEKTVRIIITTKLEVWQTCRGTQNKMGILITCWTAGLLEWRAVMLVSSFVILDWTSVYTKGCCGLHNSGWRLPTVKDWPIPVALLPLWDKVINKSFRPSAAKSVNRTRVLRLKTLAGAVILYI